jgi:hypothetical protein
MPGLFALIRPTEGSFDAALAARLVSPALDCVTADLYQTMVRRPGFPVRRLERFQAMLVSQRLNEAGLNVVVVPESEIVDPPPPIELNKQIAERVASEIWRVG